MAWVLRRPRCSLQVAGTLAAALAAAPAFAQSEGYKSDHIFREPSIGTSLPGDLADPGGIHAALADRGVKFAINYIGNVLGNPIGGRTQGVYYDGRLELAVEADLGTMFGWQGLSFFANGYQIHGESVSGQNLLLMPASSIEAAPSTRLFELWLEQKLFDETVSLRFGQLAADSEFMLSNGGGAFINGTWGWPSIAGIDLPNGGPSYPMAAPAVRLALNPSDAFELRTGLYTGDPAGNCTAPSPVDCNPNGLEFPFTDPLLIAQATFNYNQGADTLQGTFKLGGWRLFGTFPQQDIGSNGLPIGLRPLPGRIVEEAYAFYAILDQMLYRLPGAGDPRGVAVFGRIVGAPLEGNLISNYWEAGLTLSGLWDARPDDTLGVGFAYTGVSPEVSDLQKALRRPVIADYEALMEICYTAQIVPGFTIQPDFQYFWNPGGHVRDPDDPTKAVPNAAVLGLRSTVNY